MQLDLSYLVEEDRMRFSLRGQSDWLITRRMLIRLISAWVQKLQEVDLLDVGFSLGKRDVGMEHELSLEFDAPQATNYKPEVVAEGVLLQEITMIVDETSTQVVLKGEGKQSTLNLTRKESHMVLELLASKARSVQWVDESMWPKWLGHA